MGSSLDLSSEGPSLERSHTLQARNRSSVETLQQVGAPSQYLQGPRALSGMESEGEVHWPILDGTSYSEPTFPQVTQNASGRGSFSGKLIFELHRESVQAPAAGSSVEKLGPNRGCTSSTLVLVFIINLRRSSSLENHPLRHNVSSIHFHFYMG